MLMIKIILSMETKLWNFFIFNTQMAHKQEKNIVIIMQESIPSDFILLCQVPF